MAENTGVAAVSSGSVGSSSDDAAPEIPERVLSVLKAASDFGGFRASRCFNFLHLFAGPTDVLGTAIKKAAAAEGLRVNIRSVELNGDAPEDLLRDHPFLDLVAEAQNGGFDGGHGGPPCGSFSKARWNPQVSGPAPVRSREEIYGLSSNDAVAQRQADEGTLLATRTVTILGKIIQSQRRRKVPEASTLENPPGSDHGPDGPMWALPEVRVFLDSFGAILAEFNTCAYQQKEKLRWFKPAIFGGRLDGLEALRARCSCPTGFRHQNLVGKNLTQAAARYPEALCEAYAELLVKSWKSTLQLEWWRFKLLTKEGEVNDLQRKWLEAKEKQQNRQEVRGRPLLKRAWSAVQRDEDVKPDMKISKKLLREEENERSLGGMRNPWKAVRRLSKVAEVGRDIARLWRRFALRHPQALNLARAYGSPECKPDDEITMAWRRDLKTLLKANSNSAPQLREKFEFKSPLEPELWEAWARMSGDPEQSIGDWARRGAPLGMAVEIPKSNGVFPPVPEDDASPDAPMLDWSAEVKNYTSVYSDLAGASEELGRYLDKGFCRVMPRAVAEERFETGTLSKLALIVKDKEPGVVKRRIIIDLLRSGGNQRARVPERIILPRGQDVVSMVRSCWELRATRMAEHDPLDDVDSESEDEDDPGFELIGADLADAYCHFPVRREEWNNCLAPGLDENEVLLFCAMLFGFKGAPLIMGRFAAALGRLWQAMLVRDGQLQIYMDDPLSCVVGPRKRRLGVIAMLLYTAIVMGVNISFEKGHRGVRVRWIGIELELDLASRALVLAIPIKLINELREKITAWDSRGMIPFRELRAVTGKLSWVAGTIPRMRWVVSIMYAVVASVDKDAKSGVEVQRAKRRQDTRSKAWLVPLKRLELPRQWLLIFLEDPSSWLVRREPLFDTKAALMVITDASPKGVGAILAAISADGTCFEPVTAFMSKVVEQDAVDLGLKFGDSSSQGPLEAVAFLLAVSIWADKLRRQALLLRGDSVVALAVARKLASSSPALNYVGAALSLKLESLHIPKLQVHHLAGVLNVEADWLSRPEKQEAQMPAALAGIKIRKLERLNLGTLGSLPLPGKHPQVWGAASEQLSAVFDFL